MNDALPLLVIFGSFAVVLAALGLLARRVRRRGTAGGVSGALASWEEAFRVTSHAAHVEIRAQAERR
ncbi:hypothetical protein GTW43_02955, partial [Streptomyces sp. SID5785]|uniref:hypothetical protein n=1 Tax=Streptomyces sp. SID5785 TaxID=2690309 RepID=UPI001361B724